MPLAARPTFTASLLAAIALPLLLLGCAASTDVGGDGTGDGADAITENGNDKIAFDFFLAKGLSPVQAAGIVGNLDQESGMDPTISQYGGGPGRGIAQWSAGGRWDTDAHDNAAWYASTRGESVYSLNLQLEFIWYELTTFGYGYSSLRAATNVTAATLAFQDDFEICGACDASNRIAHAEAALAQFGGDAQPPPEGPPTAVPPAPSGCGTIEPGQGLVAGTSFASCDGRFTLAMQTDGNLVVYRGGSAMWATGTNGRGGYVAVMQGDGNFVVYGKHSDALWDSHTNGSAGARLVMQDDGNLVVYASNGAALWASGTNLPGAPAAPTSCGAIDPGHGLTAGTQVGSCDGRYTLAMQDDGNLVLYHNGVGAIWASNTYHRDGFNAVMQEDGNFVLYDTHDDPLWWSGTNGHGGAFLAVQDDGNLVVYAGSTPV
ncbi:MAG TPA: phage tail tip lysozyme, partial [Minicystis sp.]|nr:phage tail tip lysozyme [Minicystis sp.]